MLPGIECHSKASEMHERHCSISPEQQAQKHHMGDAAIAGLFSLAVMKRHNNSWCRYLFALEQAIFIYNSSFITYNVSLR